FAFRRQAGAGIIAVLPPARRGRDATAGGLSTTLPGTSTRPHVSAPNLHVRGLAIVTAGVFILSFDALLVRLAGATPADFGFWRGMLICVSLLTLLVAGGLGRVNVRPVGGYLLAGTVAGIGLVLFPFSIMNTHTANTVVILTSAPFFAAIFSRVFLAEPIAR